MPTTSTSALKKTNQISVLFGEIENLKSQLGINADNESTAAAAATTTTATAVEQNVEDHRSHTSEHSDFQFVQTRAEAELKRLSARLAQVSAKVDEVGKAIDTIEEYSYQFNIKIVGVPELNSQETAMDTSKLCANLFIEMGADITLKDIDIAHRMPLQSARNLPKPIICKFTWRLAKEAVMARRKDACKSIPVNLGLPDGVSLSSVRIFDHLTPKMQTVFSEAKKFKSDHHFEFCWAKNSSVYLRKDRDSRALKIKDIEDLNKLL